MASITKHRNSWTVRWRDPDGTQRRKKAPNKTVARRLKLEIETAIALGRHWQPEAAERLTVDKMLTEYKAARGRTWQPNTRASVTQSLSLFEAWLKSTTGRAVLSPTLLTQAMLDRWWDHCRYDRGNKIITANMRAAHIMQWWRWAFDREAWEGQVPRARKIDLPAVAAMATKAPTWEEMDRAWMSARGWYKRLFLLGRCTGLRRAQLMQLRWSDVDLDRMTLRVRPELGKTRQEKSGRTVPLAPVLVDQMAGWGVREGLLVGTTSKRPARLILRSIWDRAEVDKEARAQPLHSLRKGFISGLISLGANREAVEFLVGHDMGIRGVYTDPAALRLAETVALVPAVGQVLRFAARAN